MSWLVIFSSFDLGQPFDNFHTSSDAPKYSVFTVEMGGGSEGDEKLASV